MLRQLHPKDTLTLKGAAILAIVFHNYFNLLSGVDGSEFDFRPERFGRFLSTIQDPHQSIPALFAYLGHFGVQIFIFLSAYGLAKRYWDVPTGIGFLWARAKKIYPTFLAAIICWALLVGIPEGPLGPMRVLAHDANSLILTIIGVSNIYPGIKLPPVGPWWFVPFAIQWYCLWPALRRLTKRFGPWGLLPLAAAGILLTNMAGRALAPWSINLLETPVGHLPELCFGIIAARYPTHIPRATILAAGLVFIAANLYAPVWILGFPSALVIAIGIYSRTKTFWRTMPALRLLGAHSMRLFLVNGFVRLPFIAWAAQLHTWTAVLVFGVLSAGCSFGLAALMPKPYTPLKPAENA